MLCRFWLLSIVQVVTAVHSVNIQWKSCPHLSCLICLALIPGWLQHSYLRQSTHTKRSLLQYLYWNLNNLCFNDYKKSCMGWCRAIPFFLFLLLSPPNEQILRELNISRQHKLHQSSHIKPCRSCWLIRTCAVFSVFWVCLFFVFVFFSFLSFFQIIL